MPRTIDAFRGTHFRVVFIMPFTMRNHALEAVESYYHKILPFYEEENEQRDDLEFWRDMVARQKPQFVLELGAGSGRVTAELADLAPVVALDLSVEMLQRASTRLAVRSTDALFKPTLVAADMRRFAFARRFDLILAPNDPFSHLTRNRERQIALRAIARHMAPGGKLVIEGLYRSKRKRVEVPEHCIGTVSVRELWVPIGRDHCWRAHYFYRRGEKHVDAQFVARSWSLCDLNTLFTRCGLELEEIWGDFDGRPFTPDAERIILMARPSPSRPRRARIA
ncbi:MAG TPA: class I SAM-dependent methyltransferase [Bryobacteraceae bacterium]|nr:class I SAM-dependent methyltransferase [Bryobacteraceae bacterium]